jgi:hypothetical protein
MELEVQWQEHELGEYPMIVLIWEDAMGGAPWEYIEKCKDALTEYENLLRAENVRAFRLSPGEPGRVRSSLTTVRPKYVSHIFAMFVLTLKTSDYTVRAFSRATVQAPSHTSDTYASVPWPQSRSRLPCTKKEGRASHEPKNESRVLDDLGMFVFRFRSLGATRDAAQR